MLWVIDKLPDFAEGWFDALRQNPAWLWGFVVTFALLLLVSTRARIETHYLASYAWGELKGKTPPIARKPSITSRLRALWHNHLGKVTRWIFAIALFGLIVYLLYAGFIAIVSHLQRTLG